MTDTHPTVRITDQLRAAAEELRDLNPTETARSDDPLSVFRNLYAALDALRDAWPALAEAGGFEDAFNPEDLGFLNDIQLGLINAANGFHTASNSI